MREGEWGGDWGQARLTISVYKGWAEDLLLSHIITMKVRAGGYCEFGYDRLIMRL